MFSESRWIHRHFFDAKKLSSIFQKWSEKKAGLWSPQKAGRECKYLLHTSLRLTYWATRIAENPLKTNMTIENPTMNEDVLFLSKLVTFSLPWWCFPGGFKKEHWHPLTGSSSLGWVSSTHKAFHCAKFSAICVDTSAWKLWASKWLSSPRFWVKIKKMKSPPSYVYNYPEKTNMES